MFEPGTGSQIDDFNPSPVKPTGLFWTIAAPLGTAVSVNPGAGRASLVVPSATVFNYHNIVQSLVTGPAAPTATVSFEVEWSGVTSRQNVRNTSDGHAGEFAFTGAQLAWTAVAPPYVFSSDPIGTSSSSFALVGHERNGVFFS